MSTASSTAGSTAVIYRNLLVERRQWQGVAFGVLEPFLYLLSLGVGVGKLVGTVPGLAGTDVTYAQYVGPALMAMAAMNGTLRSPANRCSSGCGSRRRIT